MPRLWLRSSLTCALVFVSLGCTGQKLEGRWRGPFPLEDAKACVLNLYGDRRFDLACQDHAWVGGGRYGWTGDRIRFEFSVLAKRGERLREMPTVAAELVGKGNEVVLKQSDGASYVLVRRME